MSGLIDYVGRSKDSALYGVHFGLVTSPNFNGHPYQSWQGISGPLMVVPPCRSRRRQS